MDCVCTRMECGVFGCGSIVRIAVFHVPHRVSLKHTHRHTHIRLSLKSENNAWKHLHPAGDKLPSNSIQNGENRKKIRFFVLKCEMHSLHNVFLPCSPCSSCSSGMNTFSLYSFRKLTQKLHFFYFHVRSFILSHAFNEFFISALSLSFWAAGKSGCRVFLLSFPFFVL